MLDSDVVVYYTVSDKAFGVNLMTTKPEAKHDGYYLPHPDEFLAAVGEARKRQVPNVKGHHSGHGRRVADRLSVQQYAEKMRRE